jgi:hypothetical protein
VHVTENKPAELEHPIQGALPDFVPVAFTGAAFASAIDRIATIKPATKKNDGTFMGYLSQIPERQNAVPERRISRLKPIRVRTLPKSTNDRWG